MYVQALNSQPLFFLTLQPNTALFEACCNEKIQQFDDSGSDEEVSFVLGLFYHFNTKKIHPRGKLGWWVLKWGRAFTFIYILKASPSSEQIML